MDKYFEGFYYKHQKDDDMLALIPGIANDHAFIQVVTRERCYDFHYPLSAYRAGSPLRLGECEFAQNGVHIDIAQDGAFIHGDISYADPTPIESDIMGVFRHFPMECRHDIISLHHRLNGAVDVDGEILDFSGGTGYIESDRGVSFPRRYLWLQCNDFCEKGCISVSVAEIPFALFRFIGCICVIYHQGMEYRLATYRGVKIHRWDKAGVSLSQGAYALEAEVRSEGGHPLKAPQQGGMTRIIRENAICRASFRFYEHDTLLFEYTDRRASFEYVPGDEPR